MNSFLFWVNTLFKIILKWLNFPNTCAFLRNMHKLAFKVDLN